MPDEPAPSHSVAPRWREKPGWGWKAVLTALAVSLLATLIPCGISAALPDPETTHPAEEVVLKGTADDGGEIKVKGPDGAQLKCQKTTKGMLQGWECQDTKIVMQTAETPEDVDLGLQRAVRAANRSDTPTEPAEHVGKTSVLRLDHEQAAKYDSELSEDAQIGAYALAGELGSPDETVFVVVQGDEDIIAAVQKSILDNQKGGAK